jgi:hypothetical protein
MDALAIITETIDEPAASAMNEIVQVVRVHLQEIKESHGAFSGFFIPIVSDLKEKEKVGRTTSPKRIDQTGPPGQAGRSNDEAAGATRRLLSLG